LKLQGHFSGDAMMRVSLFALALGMGLGVSALASAAPWTDPNGRLVFEAPAGWTTTVEQSNEYTYVVTGTANNECHVIARPNAGTASSSPEALRRATLNEAQFQAPQWTTIANGMSSIFRNNNANVISRSLDTSGFWPIQRAEIQGERLVHASLQLRPGWDLLSFCMTYDGADAVQAYEAVSRSVSHPNDATWRTQAEQQAATVDSANAAVDAQNAEIEEERAREERRRRVQH
jgi:hypothetical protein